MPDLSGWAYFDDGMRMLRAGRGPLRLTDGRDVTPGELRVGDVTKSSDGQQTWRHRVIRVEPDTPRPSRWEILARD